MKRIIILALLIPLFWSCEEIGLTENSNDVSYISFVNDMTRDSIGVSFKTYNADIIRIPILVKRNGYYPTSESTEFTISANLEKTTLPTDKYMFDEKYYFSPGQVQDTVYIQLTNFDELKLKSMRLCVKINESETVKQGEANFQQAVIDVSDRLVRPSWWIIFDVNDYDGNPWANMAEEYYLGKYSEKKYTMFLEELAKDNVQFSGGDRIVLQIYSLRLKYRVKAYNDAHPGAPMMDEENHEEMTIPVAG